MLTDIGEYIVGASLQIVEECDFIDYNVRPPGGGARGMEELDVVGLNFKTSTAFLCEASTHLGGLHYGHGNKHTFETIKKKFTRQQAYAEDFLKNFKRHRFMLWSPYVPHGYLTANLETLAGLELVINAEYKRRVEQLRILARAQTGDARNPFFRMLQILEHTRD